MKRLIPPKLHLGDTIRVIAPSRPISLISKESRGIAKNVYSN